MAKLGLSMIVCAFCSLSLGTGNWKKVHGADHTSRLTKQTSGYPWPAPKQMSFSATQIAVDLNSFVFVISPAVGACDILQEAFVRYKNIMLRLTSDHSAVYIKPKTNKVYDYQPKDGNQTTITELQVKLSSVCQPDMFPSFESDESYKLEINGNDSSTLYASQVWGVLRGLETFSQLLYRNNFGMYVVNATVIEDAPRFNHRGLLLDTSLHYLSPNLIKVNLDVMSQNKLNVFHWHIVDDPSFPYESYTFPDMSVKGAYNAFTHVYTQQDIKAIVDFARLRGIRVLVEFDSPAHSQSWGLAINELLTKCYTGAQWNGNYGPINPVPNFTYSFLMQFFSEIANVFPDQYVHLGGDEVPFDCWQSNPEITEFMSQMGFGANYSKLEEYYMKLLLDIVKTTKKGYIIWQEVIDNNVTVASDAIVEVWKDNYQEELSKVTSLGYKVLLAAPWYLDLISYGSDWKKYYTTEPLNFNGTLQQKERVIGGEACMWTEFVDETNLLSRVWPRASAVAERLWSPASINNVYEAEPRLEEHRCRLIRRGYPAEPPSGPGFCKQEYVFHQ